MNCMDLIISKTSLLLHYSLLMLEKNYNMLVLVWNVFHNYETHSLVMHNIIKTDTMMLVRVPMLKTKYGQRHIPKYTL